MLSGIILVECKALLWAEIMPGLVHIIHFAAQDIFEDFPDLGIAPLFFRSFSYCKKCKSVVNKKICPHSLEDHINFSGTQIREC